VNQEQGTPEKAAELAGDEDYTYTLTTVIRTHPATRAR
jgi:hypothetical protein